MFEQKNVKMGAASQNIQRKTELLGNHIIAMSASPTAGNFFRAMRDYDIICKYSNDENVKKSAEKTIYFAWSSVDLQRETIREMMPLMTERGAEIGAYLANGKPSPYGQLENYAERMADSFLKAIDRFKQIRRSVVFNKQLGEHVHEPGC